MKDIEKSYELEKLKSVLDKTLHELYPEIAEYTVLFNRFQTSVDTNKQVDLGKLRYEIHLK